jgi:hypothetical protein
MPLRVNMTDVEVSDYDPVPSGKYRVAVTDGELKESGENAKNPGAEYIHWEFTIQDEEYQGRKVWANTSLLPHALFSLKGLLSATGFNTDGEIEFEIDDVINKECVVRVVRKGERTNPNTGETYDPTNEVKAYYKLDDPKAMASAGSSSNSLMP